MFFEWQADFALKDNQTFELIFWEFGQDPLRDGLGFAGASTATRVAVACDQVPACRLGVNYCWGVRLIEAEKPVAYLGAANECRRYQFQAESSKPNQDSTSGAEDR
jgi:hypothetical protein